jgi:hypothetical protein
MLGLKLGCVKRGKGLAYLFVKVRRENLLSPLIYFTISHARVKDTTE